MKNLKIKYKQKSKKKNKFKIIIINYNKITYWNTYKHLTTPQPLSNAFKKTHRLLSILSFNKPDIVYYEYCRFCDKLLVPHL